MILEFSIMVLPHTDLVNMTFWKGIADADVLEACRPFEHSDGPCYQHTLHQYTFNLTIRRCLLLLVTVVCC